MDHQGQSREETKKLVHCLFSVEKGPDHLRSRGVCAGRRCTGWISLKKETSVHEIAATKVTLKKSLK